MTIEETTAEFGSENDVEIKDYYATLPDDNVTLEVKILDLLNILSGVYHGGINKGLKGEEDDGDAHILMAGVIGAQIIDNHLKIKE